MSLADQDDSEFAGPDDAKTEIRAAVAYLLRGATGGTRGDIVQEIIAIVRQIASGFSWRRRALMACFENTSGLIRPVPKVSLTGQIDDAELHVRMYFTSSFASR